MWEEDGQIIHKCLNGEPSAFGFLIDKYKESVYYFAYTKLLNFHDAEDVTQEVFIKAYQNLRSLRRWDSFHTWLYSIASNRCKMWLRSKYRRPDKDYIEDKNQEVLEIPSIESYNENLTSESMNESLQEVLSSLPEIYRQVLVLYYLNGMNSREIAKTLVISPVAVLQRLDRARTMLKEEMIAMMTKAFEGRKLASGFTFRVLEAIKNIKIHPMSNTNGVPWGISLAMGLIFVLLGMNPEIITLTQSNAMFNTFSSEAKVLEFGEIPVEITKISETANLKNGLRNDDNGMLKMPEAQNAFLMAPKGEGGTWTKKADMPISRHGHASAELDGKIYVFGGGNQGILLQSVEEYDPVTDKWTAKSSMPTIRVYASASTVNGKIYVIGGMFGNFNMRNTVEEYDPKTDSWKQKAPMPTARSGLSTSVIDGKIYAIGGSQGFGLSIPTVEEYDPQIDIWTKKSDMITARSLLSTSAINGKIYAIGGDRNPTSGLSPNCVSAVEEYDPVKDKWTKKSDMPTPRSGLSTCTINNKILAIGGCDKGPNLFLSVVEEYDPVTNKWVKMTDIPTGRLLSSANTIENRAYVMGGTQNWTPPVPAISLVEEYSEMVDESISPSGKLPSTWGTLKAK